MRMLLQDVGLGKNLQKLRISNGLSQAALVRELELRGSTMSRNTYSKIEVGMRNIKISDLILLKALYDVSFDEFFRDMVPNDIPRLGKLELQSKK